MARVFLTHSAEMLEKYYGKRAVAALEALGEVRINPTGQPLSTADLAEQARGCDIIVSDRQTPGEAALFEQSPDLAAFLRCAVDIRNVDVAAASRHGVLVTHATAGFVSSVAEMALGYMIALARHIPDAVIGYRAGREPEARTGLQLDGAVLGIVGFGAIGARLATLGRALGMRVLVTDPFKTVGEPGMQQVALDELLGAADFVVCLAVATAATENLMDAAAFSRMKPSAFFVNLSRGNLVDEQALARALDERRIAGAALDVGRAPDPNPSPVHRGRPDVIATPHTGGLTPQAIEHQAFDTVRQVAELVAGRVPAGAVNAAAATRLARLRAAS
jgi:D-3-phosphoglycerate dehydrogenase